MTIHEQPEQAFVKEFAQGKLGDALKILPRVSGVTTGPACIKETNQCRWRSACKFTHNLVLIFRGSPMYMLDKLCDACRLRNQYQAMSKVDKIVLITRLSWEKSWCIPTQEAEWPWHND